MPGLRSGGTRPPISCLPIRWLPRTHARIEKRKGNFVLIDQSSNGTYVTVSGRDEIVLRREEFILHGTGVIAFGHALHERPNCEVVEFVCESANDVLRSGFATT